MDPTTRKSVFHDIILDFGIVIAACIIGGAIIFSGYIGRNRDMAFGENISERSV